MKLKSKHSIVVISVLAILASLSGCDLFSGLFGIEITSIEVTPEDASVAVGDTLEFEATAFYEDGTSGPLNPGEVTWSSGDTSISTIAATGTATGKALGSVTVTATDVNSPTSGTATLTVTGTQATCVAPTGGLQSWWPLDGDGTDHNSTNDGTVESGAAFVAGLVDEALLLDGIDDKVTVPNDPLLNPTSEITVEAWFQPTAFTGIGNESIVNKGFTTHSPPYYQYHLGVTGDLSTFSFWVAAGGSVVALETPNDTWVPGTWYHVAGTYDGTTARLYVNGDLIVSQAASGALTDYGRDLVIGGFSNLSTPTPGIVDEVAIHSVALSEAQVQAIHAAFAAGRCK